MIAPFGSQAPLLVNQVTGITEKGLMPPRHFHRHHQNDKVLVFLH
jgi:hypothetical protein